MPIPDHIVDDYGSARKFKQSKRDLLKRVIREWRDFRLGGAYTPCGVKTLVQVDALLREIEESISEKNWGR